MCSGASFHQCKKVGKHLPIISNYHSDAMPSLTNKLKSICIDRKSTKASIFNLSSSLSPLREKSLLSLLVLCHYQQLLHFAAALALISQDCCCPSSIQAPLVTAIQKANSNLDFFFQFMQVKTDWERGHLMLSHRQNS